jgi:hypothetical protein
MKPIIFNPKLIWDYDMPDDAQTNEAFREWYVGRVLTRGSDNDLRAVGFQMIHDHLPELVLPRQLREFWEWYFALPEVVAKYGHLDPVPKTNPNSRWTQPS